MKWQLEFHYISDAVFEGIHGHESLYPPSPTRYDHKTQWKINRSNMPVPVQSTTINHKPLYNPEKHEANIWAQPIISVITNGTRRWCSDISAGGSSRFIVDRRRACNYATAQGQIKVHCSLSAVGVLTLINRLINRKSDLLMLPLKVTHISVRVCRPPLL